jgi:hypothetical protein
VNVPLLVAGSLALAGAGVHGIAGELLVVRRLSTNMLPGSRFGGPTLTLAMIRASWHMTTVGFLTAGCAFLLSGSVLDGDAAMGVAVVAAAAATGFAAIALVGAAARVPRALFRHPGPPILTAVAALAWWGVAIGP